MQKVIIFAALAICVLATTNAAAGTRHKRQQHSTQLTHVDSPDHHHHEKVTGKTAAGVGAPENSKAQTSEKLKEHHHRSGGISTHKIRGGASSSLKSNRRTHRSRKTPHTTHNTHKKKRSGSKRSTHAKGHVGHGKKH